MSNIKVMGEKMAVVSIVMPVYNGEKYLRQSISSVLNQTFKDWNLIIVDDCSTDSSPEIMKEYAQSDDRIQIIHNKVNSKIAVSLNNGFENASGKYYTWTSDDNIYERNALEKMVSYLEEHADVGLVYSDMKFIDGEGNETGIFESEPEDVFSNNCVGACFMYRAEVAEKAGKYNADWFLVEDYEYWLRIRNICEIGHIDELLYQYRRHDKSLSETKMIQVREKLYDLRLWMLQNMKDKIPNDIKTGLFKEMWLQNSERHDELADIFWNGEMPVDLQWLRRRGKIDMSKKVVLFGAGAFGAKALNYLGKDKVYCYVDNNPDLKGKIVNGKVVKSFDEMEKLAKNYQVVIAVDAHKSSVLAEQLEKIGITEYITYLDMVKNYKKPELSGQVDWIKIKERYEEYLDKWLSGLESEIVFWKRYMETGGDIYFEGFKDQTEKNKHFTLERYLDGLSKTEKIRFIDIGSGPFSSCGCVSENYNLSVDAIDPLAEVYNALKKKNNLENGITIKTGFVELLDKYFDANTYDIVHMSNSLDHSFNAVFGIYQLLNLCKVGGKVILRHTENEGERSEYGGLHQWNLSVHNEEDSFIIWRKNERYDIKKILDGYATVEWNADVYEKKWKYNEVIITKLNECPIPENPYSEKMLERVYSFLLKILMDKTNNCDNTIVLRNQEMIKKMRKSQNLVNNVLQVGIDKKIDIYGMGVVGRNLIDILDNNNISINYIYDKDERKYKSYNSVQLKNVNCVDKSIVIIAVMRDDEQITEGLIIQGYKKDDIYLIENLI